MSCIYSTRKAGVETSERGERLQHKQEAHKPPVFFSEYDGQTGEKFHCWCNPLQTNITAHLGG